MKVNHLLDNDWNFMWG